MTNPSSGLPDRPHEPPASPPPHDLTEGLHAEEAGTEEAGTDEAGTDKDRLDALERLHRELEAELDTDAEGSGAGAR